jgi:hypothetical protein
MVAKQADSKQSMSISITIEVVPVVVTEATENTKQSAK